ncbi:MAG TPA: hypothetical protein VMZ53_21825 [Kofleriaceae bacterium]|nr:hypothetical protein [Kofleriaceae bacterium]
MKRFAVAALALLACSSHDKPKPQQEPERPRRVIEPPSRGVRALPPHAIRADGVGPYKLGATVSELLDQLPSGPRITQLTIPGIARRDLLRAEDDAILIGVEPQGKATFVAVVRGEIARTEAGIHVGSTRDELTHALGAPLEDLDHARDSHIVVPTGLKSARVVMEGDRIAAIVIAAEPVRARTDEAASDAATEAPCTRPPDDRSKGLIGVCLTNAGEFLRTQDDEIVLVARDGEKPVARMPVPGLVFAAALRNPLDNRDDIVAIARSDDAASRSWSLIAFRLAEGKLVVTIPPKLLYQLTAANARWIGADLHDLDLYLELSSRSDAIEVGGLLTTRISDQIRDIVVISTVPVSRTRSKAPTHEAIDAGTSEKPDVGP